MERDCIAAFWKEMLKTDYITGQVLMRIIKKIKLGILIFLIQRSHFLLPFGEISNPILRTGITRPGMPVSTPALQELSRGRTSPCALLVFGSLHGTPPSTALSLFLVGVVPKWGDISIKLSLV